MLAFAPIDTSTILIGVLVLVVLLGLLFVSKYLNLWIQAFLSKAPISLFTLVGMSLRKVNPTVIVRALIAAVQAGLKITVRDLETHYLAGGNINKVVYALIAADRANITQLDFRRAAAIDLAGRDVLDAVQTSVNPKVIDCPDASYHGGKFSGQAHNGILVLVKARVTVRTNIDRIVGGATEQTITARVGQGIVSAIGEAESHMVVLENPGLISKKVLDEGLDAGTSFDILSIDIAELEVGANVGARLQGEQAEADLKVARARAEERRAMAVAAEQEFSAEVMKNRAQVVLAEAQVPNAIADAFRSGRLGVLDYYKMQNVQADTKMRSQIAGGDDTTKPQR